MVLLLFVAPNITLGFITLLGPEGLSPTDVIESPIVKMVSPTSAIERAADGVPPMCSRPGVVTTAVSGLGVNPIWVPLKFVLLKSIPAILPTGQKR